MSITIHEWINWWITCKIEDVMQRKESRKKGGWKRREEARSKKSAPKSDISELGWWTPLQHLSAHLDTLQPYILYILYSSALYSLVQGWWWQLTTTTTGWTLWAFSVSLLQSNEKLINILLMLYRKGGNPVIFVCSGERTQPPSNNLKHFEDYSVLWSLHYFR